MSKSHLSIALVLAWLFIGALPLLAQGSSSSVQEQEAKLIALLKSEASQKEKADACRELARLGAKNAVPALAALLGDDKLAHMARYGLETIPDPAVDAALRDVLGKLKGRLLVGVIGSIGVRHDTQAIPALAQLLADADTDVAQAAARALGKMGTLAAAKAITDALPKTPATNQLAFCEGLFRCAETFAAKGQRSQALAIYDQLRSGSPALHQVRAGALRGAILTRGKEGLPLLVQAIRGDDFVLTDAAARTALEMRGAEVTQALTNELGKLSADKQIVILQTLGKRAAAAALPAIFAVAKTGPSVVRVAAVRTLPEIGHASAIPVLMEFVKDADRDVAQSAQESLAALPGKAVDDTIIGMLRKGDPGQRLMALDLIGRRLMTACIPDLLKVAGDNDPKVRSSALKKLGELGSPAELPALLDLLSRAQNRQDLDAIEQALGAVCGRAASPEVCVDQLIGQMPSVPVAQKAVLLRVLSAISGAKALKAVRAAVDDPNAEVHAAGIRALGIWKSADAVPELLALAKAAKDPTEKMLCLRGCFDWASDPEIESGQRLSMCQQVASVIQTTEEKKMLLGALRSITTLEAINVIVPYLDDAAIRDEAGTAALDIAGTLLQRTGSAKLAPRLVAPLQKVVQTMTNPDLAQRAKTLLQRAQSRAAAKGQ